MKLTDWRGNEYGVGDTVLYPRVDGRSAEMAEGVVKEIYVAFYDHDDYKWKRLGEGGVPPMRERWNHGSLCYEEVPAESETRVVIEQTRSARSFSGGKKRPARVTIVENITAVPK